MRLFGTLEAGFAVAFGVGWLAGFSYQTDWAVVWSCPLRSISRFKSTNSTC